MAKTKTKTWLVVADDRCARLLCGTRTERGTPHLEECAQVTSTWEEKEHGRPSLVGTGANTHAYPSSRHEDQERMRRQARTILEFLEREARGRKIEALALFAPDHLIGELRRALPSRFPAKIAEHHGEYAQLSLHDLARNTKVAAEIA